MEIRCLHQPWEIWGKLRKNRFRITGNADIYDSESPEFISSSLLLYESARIVLYIASLYSVSHKSKPICNADYIFWLSLLRGLALSKGDGVWVTSGMATVISWPYASQLLPLGLSETQCVAVEDHNVEHLHERTITACGDVTQQIFTAFSWRAKASAHVRRHDLWTTTCFL